MNTNTNDNMNLTYTTTYTYKYNQHNNDSGDTNGIYNCNANISHSIIPKYNINRIIIKYMVHYIHGPIGVNIIPKKYFKDF